MTWLVIFATIVILIGFNALYVSAEFSTISPRRSRLAQMAEEEENRAAQLLLPMIESVPKLDTYVAACQIGITISSLVLGFYGQATLSVLLIPYLVRMGGMADVTAQSIAATVVLILLTTLQVVLGEFGAQEHWRPISGTIGGVDCPPYALVVGAVTPVGLDF